jgi:hypothetical protein
MKLCVKCVYYVEDNTKSYCENDHWETDIDKSKLYNPFLFDCVDYEERDKVIESFMNESIKFT